MIVLLYMQGEPRKTLLELASSACNFGMLDGALISGFVEFPYKNFAIATHNDVQTLGMLYMHLARLIRKLGVGNEGPGEGDQQQPDQTERISEKAEQQFFWGLKWLLMKCQRKRDQKGICDIFGRTFLHFD